MLLLFTAFIGVLTLPFIAYFEPKFASIAAAQYRADRRFRHPLHGGDAVYLRALQFEEASVVAPFFQAVPLFGYVLAYFVLGETLSIRQMAGGALIMAGTLLVSVRFGGGARVFKLRLALLMLACGLASALSGLIFKIFAIEVEFWTTTFWMFVGEAIFGIALLAIRAYRRQLIAMVRANAAALLTINGSNELINLGGGLGNRYALMLAPLSLVQAIGSTTTLFVFAFGIGLSIFFPGVGRETLSRRDLLQKGIAAILVAVGVALVAR